MTKKINQILNQVLIQVEPSKEDLELVDTSLKDFLKRFNQNLKKLKIKAEVFIGGSFAKKTVIKKDSYDVDVFVRFDKKYDDKEISGLTAKALKGFKNLLKVHGSRDYYRVIINSELYIELIPVKKINSPEQAENITDLSYSHVKYINKNIKSPEILNDIKIAKAFCHANHCYGAESYIGGFSGYSLELLVYYYKGFINFLKAMTKVKKDKLVIDIEKYYKNKSVVLMDINSSKLNSPIILVDPTYKQRNTLAALSQETFDKFQEECSRFLKNPSIKSFEVQKTDLEKIKSDAIKKKDEFVLLESMTPKQPGDVAGSKLLKFYKHLSEEINNSFEIKNKGFNYNKKQSARYFFVAKKRNEIIFEGPLIKDKESVLKFKKEHKKTFTKEGKIYSKEKNLFNLPQFIEFWKNKNSKKIKEMYIEKLEIVE